MAKLDRLTRNVAFLATLMESRVRFQAMDLPAADEFTLHIMAAVAQKEASALSTRTRDALAAKQAQLPHLHFQVSNASTFEEAEGLPFVFQGFDRLGSATLLDVLGQPKTPAKSNSSKPCRKQLPLDGDVLRFK